MAAWTDREITRAVFRLALFQRRGMAEQDAGALVDRLALRDQECDDRRVCIECSHLAKDGGCFAARQGWIRVADRRLTPIKTMLARCECFEWLKP